jgi:hypothetical protein
MACAETIPDNIYFLHVLTDGIKQYETEGMAFASIAEVWAEAMRSSTEILRDMTDMKPGLDWCMEVADAAGALLFRFSFKAEKLEN